jgi:hypothetical protein
MRPWIAIAACAAATAAAAPAQAAISADLAKQCREMMVKAHPTVMYGTNGAAAAQREYFQDCIKRQGKVDNGGSAPTTNGLDRH